MEKSERLAMQKRFHQDFGGLCFKPALTLALHNFTAKEVTRAVRAERKAQRDTDELWASHRRRADDQMIERAKGMGRKRT